MNEHGQVCAGCREIKPLEEFALSRRSHTGRQGRCRACQRAYYVASRARNVARARSNTRVAVLIARHSSGTSWQCIRVLTVANAISLFSTSITSATSGSKCHGWRSRDSRWKRSGRRSISARFDARTVIDAGLRYTGSGRRLSRLRLGEVVARESGSRRHKDRFRR